MHDGKIRKKMSFDAGKIGFCHCTLVVQVQVKKKGTDVDLSLLYILILGTYSKFARKNNFLALGVYCPARQRAFIRSRPQLKRLLRQWCSSKEECDGQTAQLAGSKTARHEPAAGAADDAPKLPTGGAKNSKRSNFIPPVSQLFGKSGICACLLYLMVTSLLLVPFSSAQYQQNLTCLLLIVTQCHLW